MHNSITSLLLAGLLLLSIVAGAQTHSAIAPTLVVKADEVATSSTSTPATSAPTPVAAPDAEFTPPVHIGTVRDSVYINPSQLPIFPGGDGAMAEYLRKNIRYPAMALQRHISGRVYVNFVLSAEGRVVDAHVTRGPGSGLNEEALRLVWLMPTWKPGRQQGQAVRVACTVPINFDSGR